MHTQTNSGPAVRHYLRPNGPVPAPVWYLGLDLGQRQSHTAMAIFHLQWTPIGRCAERYDYLFTPELTVRSLERYPLNNTYQNVPGIVAARAAQINDRHRAAHPHTNASMQGGPVVDHLRATVPHNVAVKPVMITSGTGENLLSGGFSGIPRRSLVTRLLQLITSGCLICPKQLENLELWVREMLTLSGCGGPSNKTGEHDDLTMAAALAAWAAVNDAKELAPGDPDGRNRPSNTIGFVDKPLF